MDRKLVLIPLLSFLALVSTQVAWAATIPSANLDKTTYLAGQTGYIIVTIFNDKSEKIRVTELSATISYYYTSGNVYQQKFFYPTDLLPDEIPAGESEAFQISISLPTDIANGYTTPIIEARTELWRSMDSRWLSSDWPTYNRLKLYVESPYKAQYEDTQQQLQEQTAANQSLNSTMNLLAGTTLVFAAAAGVLMFMHFARRTKAIPVPQA